MSLKLFFLPNIRFCSFCSIRPIKWSIHQYFFQESNLKKMMPWNTAWEFQEIRGDWLIAGSQVPCILDMDWRRTWLPYMQHWGTGNLIAFCWPQFQNWSIVDDALFENHKNSNGQNETGSFQYFSAEKHAALGVGENLVFLSFIKTESFLSGNLACAFSCLLFSILTIYRSFFPTRIALFHASSKFVLFSLSCSVVLFLAKHEIALDQKWNISTL